MPDNDEHGPAIVIIDRFWDEVVNQGYLDRIDELFAPHYILHHLPTRRDFYRDTPHPFNRFSFKDLIEWARLAFPGARVIVNQHLLTAGDLVVTRLTVRGVSAADPTRYVDLPAISTNRVTGGRIHESWFVWEPLRAEQEFQTSPAEGIWVWPPRWW